ncbi:hypothetical protein H8356DRAFT_1421342 [Neocallimastix lanati (nom. inval.)]|nr:hypothetical protein H8356DRAFT_1421342 [Neocallimastix sp. JGI-2020a]
MNYFLLVTGLSSIELLYGRRDLWPLNALLPRLNRENNENELEYNRSNNIQYAHAYWLENSKSALNMLHKNHFTLDILKASKYNILVLQTLDDKRILERNTHIRDVKPCLVAFNHVSVTLMYVLKFNECQSWDVASENIDLTTHVHSFEVKILAIYTVIVVIKSSEMIMIIKHLCCSSINMGFKIKTYCICMPNICILCSKTCNVMQNLAIASLQNLDIYQQYDAMILKPRKHTKNSLHNAAHGDKRENRARNAVELRRFVEISRE